MSRSPKSGNGKPSAEDLDLWHSLARTAKPLKGRPTAPPKPPSGRTAPVPVAADTPTAPPPPIAARAGTSRRPGPPALDRRTADRLKRGILPIEARLDLHGLTEAAAFDALGGFIRRAAAAGRRHTLVITGKGREDAPGAGTPARRRGVLHNAVPRWLAEPPLADLVIGIASAGPGHGSEGAYYIVLRRPRKPGQTQ